MTADKTLSLYFSLFNEIGIISQLSSALVNEQLPKGLSNAHFNVLIHLDRLGDGQTPLAISRAFQLPKTTMTHTLCGLDAHQLIEMRPNPKDGRSKCVWLTQKGRVFRNKIISNLAPDLIKLSTQIPQDHILATVTALVEIRKIMDANRED
ncbi:MAG: MarR family winged helix-turn-helix transcriptional regulator [Emcibacter sp.]|nr:MarR family winged helix-turn-helix transcriptional regulator [Emcibacter sp.]